MWERTEKMSNGFTRARSPEQKKERMQEIMRVTEQLFREQTYHEITLTTIAEALGWSRGNLYKYVSTKEEIFLELYLEKQNNLVRDMEEAFADADMLPDEEFAARWSRVFEGHMEYLKYHGILGTIIETNVTVDRLADFKKNSFAGRAPVYRILKNQCPYLSDKEIRQFYLNCLYQGCGLYSHTHLSELLRQALTLAGLPAGTDAFGPMFEEYIRMYLYYRRHTGEKEDR